MPGPDRTGEADSDHRVLRARNGPDVDDVGRRGGRRNRKNLELIKADGGSTDSERRRRRAGSPATSVGLAAAARELHRQRGTRDEPDGEGRQRQRPLWGRRRRGFLRGDVDAGGGREEEEQKELLVHGGRRALRGRALVPKLCFRRWQIAAL